MKLKTAALLMMVMTGYSFMVSMSSNLDLLPDKLFDHFEWEIGDKNINFYYIFNSLIYCVFSLIFYFLFLINRLVKLELKIITVAMIVAVFYGFFYSFGFALDLFTPDFLERFRWEIGDRYINLFFLLNSLFLNIPDIIFYLIFFLFQSSKSKLKILTLLLFIVSVYNLLFDIGLNTNLISYKLFDYLRWEIGDITINGLWVLNSLLRFPLLLLFYIFFYLTPLSNFFGKSEVKPAPAPIYIPLQSPPPIGTSSPVMTDESQPLPIKSVPPLSKPFYFGSFCAVGAINFILDLIIWAALGSGEPETAIALSCLSIPLSIYIVVVCAVLWYKAWQSIQDGYARTTPGKAIGFTFIPFYNIYWIFQAFWGFAVDYNSFIRRHKIQTRELPPGLYLALCILGLVGAIIYRIPVPGLGTIYNIPHLIIGIMAIYKLCDAVNALSLHSSNQNLPSVDMPAPAVPAHNQNLSHENIKKHDDIIECPPL
jgi:hypothetical protein